MKIQSNYESRKELEMEYLYNATSLKGCLWKKGEGIVRTRGGR